jgi:hypothetical protein
MSENEYLIAVMFAGFIVGVASLPARKTLMPDAGPAVYVLAWTMTGFLLAIYFIQGWAARYIRSWKRGQE